MKNVWKIIIVIGLALLLGTKLIFDVQDDTSIVENGNPDIPVGITKGEQAPDFIGTTLAGETFQLRELRGKTVLINVFATWCGPCRLEAPHLAQVYEEMGGDEVEFIGLNLMEQPEDVAAFKAEFDWEFPLILNRNGDLTDIYQPLGLPTSWLIGPDGVIQYVHTGPVTAEMLTEAIMNIQKEGELITTASID